MLFLVPKPKQPKGNMACFMFFYKSRVMLDVHEFTPKNMLDATKYF